MSEAASDSNTGGCSRSKASFAEASVCLQSVRYDDCKVFNDPIHGHISLHPLLVKIVDTPQFQRLRNIKQLGGVYYVYPGASHNRFEHSIGVAHLAEKLTRMLQQRQEELNISEEDILCVAIAGLCHDLGHGPFSHLFDGMFLPEVRPDCKWKHEIGSCDMLDHLIKVNNLEEDFKKYKLDMKIDILFIKEMIAGPVFGHKDETGGDTKSYRGRKSDKRFLYEIVSNERNKMDVDKWDYFARDCYHLGIHNSFDHNRFMHFMKVLESDDGQLQLCARDKELMNLHEMFHTRSMLHQRAYQHKTCLAIELMISKALVKADEHITISGTEGKPCKISECIDDLVAYTKLNDCIFDVILHSDGPNLEPARKLLERIQKRKLFVCIGAIALQGNTTCLADEMVKNIIDCDAEPKSLHTEDIIVRKTKIDHGKGEENPVDSFGFFRKTDTNKAQFVKGKEISRMLPQEFQEKKILIWCTNDEKLDVAKECWRKWKESKPDAKTLDITWTPMKKERRQKDKINGGKRKASTKLVF